MGRQQVGTRRTPRVAVITMGHAPRPDVMREIVPLLGEAECDEFGALDIEQVHVGRRRVAGRIECQAGFVSFGLKGKRKLTAAAFGGIALLAKVAGFVGCDAEKPRLKLTFALKGIEVADDAEKNFLTNLFHIFAREVGSELKDKTPRRRVVAIKQLVPRVSFTLATARQELRFGFHCRLDCNRKADV